MQDDDPTHGYVDYVAQSVAQSAGLINTNNSQIYMGVDSTNVASGRGRQSVRLTSKAMYNHGLIVLDLEHMPGAACGVWPAFWTVGPDWPSSGEIDIIEGVNTQTSNAITLHTGSGCSIDSGTSQAGGGSSNAAAIFSGSVTTSNCDVDAAGQSANAGCSIGTSDSFNYGDGLNANKGGVYATEWNSDVIRTWFFPRGSIPSDIASSPDPSSWGTPLAAFQSTTCEIDSIFKNQQIVFDTTFCGDWAGAVWSSDATCSTKASTCDDYVQNNPEAFTNAFWTINSLKVFTGAASSNGTSPGASQSASSAIATASRSSIGASSGVSTDIPWGKPSSVPPFVASVYSSEAGPTTTFATTTGQATQDWSGNDRTWTAWGGDSWGSRTRQWGRAGFRWDRQGRSVAEETPAPVSLPRPVVRSVDTQEDVDINMVRRHIREHKRHQHGRLL